MNPDSPESNDDKYLYAKYVYADYDVNYHIGSISWSEEEMLEALVDESDLSEANRIIDSIKNKISSFGK